MGAWAIAAAPAQGRHGRVEPAAISHGHPRRGPEVPRVSYSAEAYAHQLRQLLPRGAAWVMESTDNRWKLLLGLAEELARVHGRSEDLLKEIDPRTALELLPEWEELVGLPDEIVTSIPATVVERRIAIMQKLLARGGQSRAYFIELAAASGFLATIIEYTSSVARVGRFRCGDRLYGVGWSFTWRMNVSLSSPALEGWASTVVWLRTGSGRCGNRLRGWNGPVLQLVIRRAAPAHTTVLFTYS